MAKKKYKPTIGDKIDFFNDKSKETGTITFVGSSAIAVYPHSVPQTDPQGKPLDGDRWVELKDIIGIQVKPKPKKKK